MSTGFSALGKLTIPQLRRELLKYNAKVSGRKQELVQRLESYRLLEQNPNFSHPETREEYNMLKPADTTYYDINTDSKVPCVTLVQVESFLELFDHELTNKTKNLYHGKFLKTIRYAAEGEKTFIAGRVCAEMRKTIVYRVDIQLYDHGVLQESQCECACGMGTNAHCKHVIVVLYSLTKAKEGIVTMETCTQQLQTFHQAKKYNGSPVKMADLQLRKDGSLQYLSDFDPRPERFRNQPEYPNRFRNVWLNSQATDIPIRQLYPPANIVAIHHDHDYLEDFPEKIFLDKLSITAITENERERVQQATMGQSKK